MCVLVIVENRISAFANPLDFFFPGLFQSCLFTCMHFVGLQLQHCFDLLTTVLGIAMVCTGYAD